MWKCNPSAWIALLSLVGSFFSVSATKANARPVWREAFQASPASYPQVTDESVRGLVEQMKMPLELAKTLYSLQQVDGTIRYRLAVNAAGSALRVRLSNEEGSSPLNLNAISVGAAGESFSARAGSLRKLTFGGQSAVTIPVGASVLSDPLLVSLEFGTELLLSVSLATPIRIDARGGMAMAVTPGDATLSDSLGQFTLLTGRPLISSISVLSNQAPKIVVAFGDSITDANRVSQNAHEGWPEELARRLAARKKGGPYTVVNAGLGGNRLLTSGWGASGLTRLDRDALRIDDISHLILLEGTNDIGMPGNSMFGSNPAISAEALIAGYRQVIARAHARGVKVYIGTLTPTGGSVTHGSPEKIGLHEAVNRWIRTSGEPDAVIDFNAILSNPADRTRLLPQFDSGDQLHPSTAGLKAMGAGIDLRLFP